MPSITKLAPPSRWQMLFEVQAAAELANLGFRYRELTRTRAKFTHPIMLFPGFGTSERALSLLNGYLKNIGAEVYDWGIGKNHGYVPDLLPQLVGQARTLSKQLGKKLNLVGWSLGGYLAREVAREAPQCVEKIATLGAPVIGGPKYTSIGAMYTKWGFDLDAMEKDVESREANPIQNEILALYSKGDNIVNWRACIDHVSPNVHHEEVTGSHLGLIVNARVYESLRNFFQSDI